MHRKVQGTESLGACADGVERQASMSDRYRVDRSIIGGYTVRQTNAAEDMLRVGGWVVGSLIGGTINGIAALARNSQDRRVSEEIDEMTEAAETENFVYLLKIATAFSRKYKKDPAGAAFVGLAMIGLERHDEAMTWINHSEQLGVHPLDATALRANLYGAKRDVTMMLREYTSLAQHAETRRLGLLGRVQALADLGDYDQAISDINKAIAILPDETAYELRAEVYRAQGNLEKAFEDYARAIRLAPHWTEPLERRAQLYDSSGRVAEANADREEAHRVAYENDRLAEARKLLKYLRNVGADLKIARNGRDLELVSWSQQSSESINKIKRLKQQLLQTLASE